MVEMLNMDCMKYMNKITDKFFDLAIVDPPYGIGVDGKNIIPHKNDINNYIINNKIHNFDKNKPNELYFNELFRVSKEQIIWGGNYFLDILGYCKAPIIWDKLNNGESIYADGEFAWTSSGLPKNLKIFRHQWRGCFKDSERNIKRIHPTQKPIALYKWLLTKYAKPGWKILDTHGGSGSICIAALDLGFDLIWMEIDEYYYKYAKKRYDDFAKQGVLFEANDFQNIV